MLSPQFYLLTLDIYFIAPPEPDPTSTTLLPGCILTLASTSCDVCNEN